MSISTMVLKRIQGIFTNITPEAKTLISNAQGLTGRPPKKEAGNFLKAYNTHPWLRAAESVISNAVADLEWKLLAIRKGNSKAQPNKILSLDDAVRGGGRWFRPIQIKSSGMEVRHKLLKQAMAQGELVEIFDHPMLDVLFNMNAYFTGRQVRKLITIYLDIIGEAPLLKERKAGVPVGLWPIPPHWVRQIATPAHPFYSISWGGGSSGAKGAITTDIPEEDILWMLDPDPHNPYGRGSGHVMALGDELEISEYIAKYKNAFFLNSARPDFIVEIDGLGSADTRRVEQGFNAQHRGFWKAFKAHFINKAIKLHQIQANFKDQTLTDLTTQQRDIIAQAIGLPPEKIGIIENSNKATSQAADLTFTKDVVTPRGEMQRAMFQEKLLPEYDDRLVIDFESPVPADEDRQLDAAKAHPSSLMVDEWRELQGFGTLPDDEGQVYLIQGQPKVIESFQDLATMQADDRDQAAQQFGFGDSNNDDDTKPTNQDEEDLEDDDDEDKGKTVEDYIITFHKGLSETGDRCTFHQMYKSPTLGKYIPQGTVISKSFFVDTAPDEVEYADVHRIADRHHGELSKAIIRAFDALVALTNFDELIAALERQEPATSVAALIPWGLLSAPPQKDLANDVALKQFMANLLGTIAIASGEMATFRMSEVLGRTINLSGMDADAIAWAARYAGVQIKNISAATRKAIVDIILEGYVVNRDVRQIAKNIELVIGLDSQRAANLAKFAAKLQSENVAIDEFTRRVSRRRAALLRKRAITIARTENITASNMGQQMAWNRALTDGVIEPDNTRKVWIITPDDRLDSVICEPMPTMQANQDVALNGLFTTGDGRMISQPTAHPNCRCTTGLVVKGEVPL